jgi:hypothetical protein
MLPPLDMVNITPISLLSDAQASASISAFNEANGSQLLLRQST